MSEPLLRSASDIPTTGPGFAFEVPMSVFEKADAPVGKQRRIAGLISTESPDRQRETLLQQGLDLDDFVAHGWYNDNHSKATTDILGYPESVKQYQRGQILPDNTVAQTNCTWAEGYLLNTKKADEIWELGLALQSTGRRLGYSVEGAILKRMGAGNRIIAKARVRNVAITNCPVNTDARLEVLARSLAAIEMAANHEPLDKTLTVGTGTGPVAGAPAATGEGAGRVLGTQDLEAALRTTAGPSRPKRKKRLAKSLNDAEAIACVQREVPGCSVATATDVVRLTKALKRRGLM